MNDAHILIVEDHPQVRQFIEIVLSGEGYAVTAARNGDAALALLEGGIAPDLLLSDIRMAGTVDGIELARWVRAHRPGVAILLQTGFSEVRVEEFRVLQKPYTPDILLATIRRALDETRRD